MEEKVQPRLDQWTDFAGKFLKAEHIASFPIILVCNKVESYFDAEDNAHLVLEFAHLNKKWKWEANVTNRKILKEIGDCVPKDLYLKKITFNKHQVRNPATKAMVDSLIVVKVE